MVCKKKMYQEQIYQKTRCWEIITKKQIWICLRKKVTTLRIIGIENESKNYEIRKPYSSG